VDHRVSDHTSILTLIEWRWGLAPLTARDASQDVQNLASVLDFGNPDPDVLALPRPPTPAPAPCPSGTVQTVGDVTGIETPEFAGLLDSPLIAGWPIYP
jgi:phospholipase C